MRRTHSSSLFLPNIRAGLRVSAGRQVMLKKSSLKYKTDAWRFFANLYLENPSLMNEHYLNSVMAVFV